MHEGTLLLAESFLHEDTFEEKETYLFLLTTFFSFFFSITVTPNL